MNRAKMSKIFDEPDHERDKKELIEFILRELSSEELQRQSLENLTHLVKTIKLVKHGK